MISCISARSPKHPVQLNPVPASSSPSPSREELDVLVVVALVSCQLQSETTMVSAVLWEESYLFAMEEELTFVSLGKMLLTVMLETFLAI